MDANLNLAIEHWALADLLPYAHNARLHSAVQVSQIAASITEFGFNVPCLIDDNGQLIAGHGRLLAAQKLDMPTVPVIRLGHLTPDQVKAFRLADNKLMLNSEWDLDALQAELAQLHDIDITALGFTEEELQEIMQAGQFDPGELDDQGDLSTFKTLVCPHCGGEIPNSMIKGSFTMRSRCDRVVNDPS